MVQSAASTTAEKAFFHAELAKLGPKSPPSSWSLTDANRYCQRIARASYENFTVVSWFLPRKLRQDFFNAGKVDLADEIGTQDESLELLKWWRQQLQLCFSGRPAHPIMVALQQTIRLHNLPIDHFTDLLSAFTQDQTVFRYADDNELLDYCCRSADPVGRIILKLAGANNEFNDELSDQVCTGLQLANFCQDMLRDSQIGRIYLPRTRWVCHDVTEEEILLGKPTTALRQALSEWVQHARGYFGRGAKLIDQVPSWLSTDIELFIGGGNSILDAIESQGYDVWTVRPQVSKAKKIKLLARSLAGRFNPLRRKA